MFDSGEEGISKLEGVIADIRMINLHITNVLSASNISRDRQNEMNKRNQDLKKLNIAHIHQYSKRVSDYLKKTYQEMEKSKITIAPIIFRMLKNVYQQ